MRRRRVSAADADSCPASTNDSREKADGCANGTVAAQPYAREVAARPPPCSAAVAMRATLARRLREWRDGFRCAPPQRKLAAAPLWPCAGGPWRHSIGDARGPGSAAPGFAASCTTPGHGGCCSTCERATVARRIGAALARVALLLCLCSAAPKLAAGLLQHCAQGHCWTKPARAARWPVVI